jgi:hypothetical protein
MKNQRLLCVKSLGAEDAEGFMRTQKWITSWLTDCLMWLSLAVVSDSALGATVAWWRFQEGVPNEVATGANTIIDSANGFNGTPVGGPVYVNVDVPNGSPTTSLGLKFDGVAARVFIEDNPAFYLTNSLTLEAFIRCDGQAFSFSESQIIFRGDDRAGLDPYFLELDPNGALGFGVEPEVPDAISWLVSPLPVARNVLLHVAGTLDGVTGQQKLYINGQEVASTNTTLRAFGRLDPSQSPGLGIGNTQSPSYGEYFDGVITEVRISDVALEPRQFLFAPCVITEVSLAADGIRMGWASLTNRYYQVQWTPELSPASWSSVGPVMDGNGTTNYFFDARGTNTSKFYRIEVLP